MRNYTVSVQVDYIEVEVVAESEDEAERVAITELLKALGTSEQIGGYTIQEVTVDDNGACYE